MLVSYIAEASTRKSSGGNSKSSSAAKSAGEASNAPTQKLAHALLVKHSLVILPLARLADYLPCDVAANLLTANFEPRRNTDSGEERRVRAAAARPADKNSNFYERCAVTPGGLGTRALARCRDAARARLALLGARAVDLGGDCAGGATG